jgi:D-psicose/D-tagatose/L-ribulose 3-epimerase
MRLGLINSAWVQAGKGTAWGIRQTKAIGFDTIDIFADPLDIDIRERTLIRTECENAGLPVVSVACVATGLIDFNPSVQRFHRQRCEAYLDFCFELGAHNLLLVLGEYIWDRQVIPATEQWQTAVRQLQHLGDYADRLGLKIALELEPFRLSLVNDAASMLRFLDDVNHPAVGANIDISHLVLSKVPSEALRDFRGRAFHVHISDCDGLVHGDLPPGRGVIDFMPYLQEIAVLNIPGAISIELEYSPEPDRIVDWVTEAYRETRRLMGAVAM